MFLLALVGTVVLHIYIIIVRLYSFAGVVWCMSRGNLKTTRGLIGLRLEKPRRLISSFSTILDAWRQRRTIPVVASKGVALWTELGCRNWKASKRPQSLVTAAVKT